jgi:CheY-like chemotaxis protein
MARIVIIDEDRDNGTLLAATFAAAGHDVVVVSSPAGIVEVQAFAPIIVFMSLYRRPDAFGRPIGRFWEDVGGADSVRVVERLPGLRDVPRIVIGHGVDAADLPRQLDYMVYMACHVDPAIALPIVGGLCLAHLPALAPAPAPEPVEAVEPTPYTAVIIHCGTPAPL